MASSLLALLDDIATLMDDISVMTKVAAKKTAGVLGDDLALNAHQVSGIHADRELPVVLAVMKGSFINKAILVPAALLISAFLPWLIVPLLMVGGLYLCFEGAEKVLHTLLHRQAAPKEEDAHESFDEAARIKGAVRTDFILSAEIVVIALGTMATASLGDRVAALTLIAILMTVGVYGLVGAIVKMDDLGLYWLASKGEGMLSRARRAVGRGLLALMPKLMKTLSVVGTIAMFLVGGGILMHGLPLGHALEGVLLGLPAWPGLGVLVSGFAEGAFGLLAGAVVVALVALAARLSAKPASA